MRIALLSDIHGNSLALDAVLADIDKRGAVDSYWVLGDLVALGHDPVGVLDRLHSLSNAQFTRGNTDRTITEPPSMATEDDLPIDLRRLNRVLTYRAAMAWCRGAITAAGYFDWLANLPLELRVVLPDGSRFLGVHASPGSDDSWGFHPRYPEEEMVARMEGADADIVCVGHTHWPMNRELAGVHLVNISPVHMPTTPDLRLKYAILEADDDGYTITHHYLEQDRDELKAAIRASNHPCIDMLLDYADGLNSFPWPEHIEDPLALLPEADHPYTFNS